MGNAESASSAQLGSSSSSASTTASSSASGSASPVNLSKLIPTPFHPVSVFFSDPSEDPKPINENSVESNREEENASSIDPTIVVVVYPHSIERIDVHKINSIHNTKLPALLSKANSSSKSKKNQKKKDEASSSNPNDPKHGNSSPPHIMWSVKIEGGASITCSCDTVVEGTRYIVTGDNDSKIRVYQVSISLLLILIIIIIKKLFILLLLLWL